jgi:pyridoxal 5'-phosphate synthase pdxS subunit
MAKVRIGHIIEARILEALKIDFIDESEVLTPADDRYQIDKTQFTVPFVCGARNLGEALRRIGEGASMIRTKGEAGTGDIVEAVKHLRTMHDEMKLVQAAAPQALMTISKEMGAPYDLICYVHTHGRLPVLEFSAGGVATPADAAFMMALGAEGIFVGSGIFKSSKPEKRAQAIVKAVASWQDARILAEISKGLGEPMSGIDTRSEALSQRYAERGDYLGTPL